MNGRLRLPKVIFFDLDDTLCGYWDAAKLGLRATFEKHAPEGFTADQLVEAWAEAFRGFCPFIKDSGWYEGYLKFGEPTRTEVMRRMLANLGIPSEELAHTLSQSYMDERDRALKLFPEAIEVLDKLALSHKLGLLTNGPADIQRQEVATCGIEEYFEWICIEGELGRGKPLPEVFEYVRSLAGCKTCDMLFVGNSYHHDVVPALKAGWQAIWIRRPSDVAPSALAPEEKPEDGFEPTMIISDLRELLTAFSS